MTYRIEDHPKAARREPSELQGWICEVLYCVSKGIRAFILVLETEGRGVCLKLPHEAGHLPLDEVLVRDQHWFGV